MISNQQHHVLFGMCFISVPKPFVDKHEDSIGDSAGKKKLLLSWNSNENPIVLDFDREKSS